MTEKLDLKKALKHLYNPGAEVPEIIDVPEMAFLMIDGAGDPNTNPDYQAAVAALYGTAYKVKFACKKELERDFTVMPLEGLWWGTPKGQHTFTPEDKAKFMWTMMIMLPDFVMAGMVHDAMIEVLGKKDLPILEDLRFEHFNEGKAVQIMHIGPYDAEGPTVERMHQFAFDQGYRLRGKHHEIYLSDPRRAKPDKLRTIIRHPVEKA